MISSSFETYLDMFFYNETSSGLPRKSSVMFGSRKCSETICLAFGQLLENLRKSAESVRKSSENRQEIRH